MIETFLTTKRDQIPSDFDYTSPVMPEHVINSSRTDFISWYTVRYRLIMDDSNFNLASYIATASLVSSGEIIPTLCALTLIKYHSRQYKLTPSSLAWKISKMSCCRKIFLMDRYGPTKLSIELPKRFSYCDLKNFSWFRRFSSTNKE